MTDRRAISQRQRLAMFTAQNGICADCPRKLMPGMYHADHRIPLADGGADDESNLKLICLDCHKAKTRGENRSRAHHKRIAAGGKTRKGKPMPGSRASKFKRKMDGTVERRDPLVQAYMGRDGTNEEDATNLARAVRDILK